MSRGCASLSGFTQRPRPALGRHRPRARCPPRSGRVARRSRRAGSELSPPSSRKSVPFTKSHAALLGALEQRVAVGALGQVDPEEVAALGHHEAGVGQVAGEGVAGGVAALAERGLDRRDRAVDGTRVAELGDDRLGHHVRRDVGLGGLLADCRDRVRWARPGSRPGCRGRPSSRTRTRRRRRPSSPPSSSIVGCCSPSKRSSTYGSSSKIVKP